VNNIPKGGPTIAIVDDDASMRRSLLRVVQSAGYQAQIFASAREFLEWLPRNRAACLVLDVHMNEMNGFELQERLAVPIIFITAHDDAPTVARIERSGAAGHLQKPFDPNTVLSAIHQALRVSHDRIGGRESGGLTEGTTQATDPLSPPSSWEGSGGDGGGKP
jgi:FixJ family two-component response regulator